MSSPYIRGRRCALAFARASVVLLIHGHVSQLLLPWLRVARDYELVLDYCTGYSWYVLWFLSKDIFVFVEHVCYHGLYFWREVNAYGNCLGQGPFGQWDPLQISFLVLP